MCKRNVNLDKTYGTVTHSLDALTDGGVFGHNSVGSSLESIRNSIERR
jgi:hypothetical protein